MRDGHIHSPYCPHGSSDTFEDYIKKAIEVGLKEITFTEHMSLPKNFIDPSPNKDSGIEEENILRYFEDISKLKEKYKYKIKINVGIEVDYLEGYEKEIRDMLDKYGSYLDDSILSVHMIKIGEEFHLLDFSEKSFKEIIRLSGSLEAVYNKYYETVKMSIKSDLGKYKPKRIGHLNRVREFNQLFPYDYEGNKILYDIVKLIKEDGYELDYNVSGLRKVHCREAYVHGHLLDIVKEHDIPLVLGSDAHSAKDIGGNHFFYK